jgi:methyl-accepting chemotaxis protein
MFKNMKLITKQISGFVLICLIVAIVGAIGMYGLRTTNKAFDVVMDEELPMAGASLEGMIAVISGRDQMRKFLLTEDAVELDKIEEAFRQSTSDFDKHAGYISKNGRDELKKLANEADEHHGVFQENALELMERQREQIENEKKADLLMKSFDQHADELKNLLVDYEEKLTSIKEIDEKVDAAMEAKTFVIEQRVIAEEYIQKESIEETGKLRKEFKDKEARFDSLEELLPNEVVEEHKDYGQLAIKMFDQYDNVLRIKEEARKHMALVDDFSEQADLTMDKVEEVSATNMDAAMARADAVSSMADRLISIITLVGFIIGVTLGFFISRSITKPLGQSITELNTASEELQTSAQQQMTSTTQQATTTTQLSTIMKELVVASNQISETASGVVSSSEGTNNSAKEGKMSLETAVEGMKRIKEQVDNVVQNMLSLGEMTQQMGLVLEIIKELAEQTTILSYNATIEAAGAGEGGRRFSALAEQIMKLADKAMESTKEIRTMIEDVQKSANKTVLVTEDGTKAVDEGMQLIQDSRKHFDSILVSAEENLTSAKEIEMTLSQQNTTIGQTAEDPGGC